MTHVGWSVFVMGQAVMCHSPEVSRNSLPNPREQEALIFNEDTAGWGEPQVSFTWSLCLQVSSTKHCVVIRVLWRWLRWTCVGKNKLPFCSEAKSIFLLRKDCTPLSFTLQIWSLTSKRRRLLLLSQWNGTVSLKYCDRAAQTYCCNPKGEEEEENKTHTAALILLNKGTKSKCQYCMLLILG